MENLVKRLVSRGKSENQAKAIATKVEGLSKSTEGNRHDYLAKKDESWKDCQLMQPTSEWDKTDLKGAGVGDQYLWMPSEAYKRRFDEIDWTDE